MEYTRNEITVSVEEERDFATKERSHVNKE